MVRISRLDDDFSGVIELEAIPIEGQQGKEKKERQKKIKKLKA